MKHIIQNWMKEHIFNQERIIKRYPENVFSVLLSLVVLIIFINLVTLTPISILHEYILKRLDIIPDMIVKIGSYVLSQAVLILLVFSLIIYSVFNKRHLLAIKILSSTLAGYIFAICIRTIIQYFEPSTNLFSITNNVSHAFPSTLISSIVTLYIVIKPHIKNSNKKFAFYILLFLISAAVLSVQSTFLGALGGVFVGWFTGSLMHLTFGIETKQKTPNQILQILQKLGYKAQWLEQIDADARGSLPLIVCNSDGTKLFVKVISKEHLDADSLFKLWRKLFFRNLKHEMPFLTVMQKAEHEGFLSTLAQNAGISTPKVLGAASDVQGNGYLMYEFIEGKGLDSVISEKNNEEFLIKLWEQVKLLHAARIAHRDLRLANIFVKKNGEPMLMDFGFSESYASIDLLGRDLIEIFVSLAVYVKPDIVVKTSLQLLDKKIVEASLKYLQPVALSTATRELVNDNPEVLSELRNQFAKALNIEKIEDIRITRFNKQSFIVTLLFLLTIYFLAFSQNIVKETLLSHKLLSIFSIVLIVIIYFLWQVIFSYFENFGYEEDFLKAIRRIRKRVRRVI